MRVMKGATILIPQTAPPRASHKTKQCLNRQRRHWPATTDGVAAGRFKGCLRPFSHARIYENWQMARSLPIALPVCRTSKDTAVNSSPPIAKHALAAQIEAHLLCTVGVASEDATPTDLMQAVAQVARGQLSQRWVESSSF